MLREILISPTEKGFAAVVVGFPNCLTEAATRDEAIRKARDKVEKLLTKSEIIQVEVNGQTKGEDQGKRKSFAGMWADDETFDDFLAAMKAYREEVNADPNQP